MPELNEELIERLSNAVGFGTAGLMVSIPISLLIKKLFAKKLRKQFNSRKERNLIIGKRELDKLRKRIIPSKLPIYLGGVGTSIQSYYIPPESVPLARSIDRRLDAYFSRNKKAYKSAVQYGMVVVPKKVHMHVLLHEVGHARGYVGEGSRLWMKVMDKAGKVLYAVPVIGPHTYHAMFRLPEEVLATRYGSRKAKDIIGDEKLREYFTKKRRKKVKEEEVSDVWRTLSYPLMTYVPDILTFALPIGGLIYGWKSYNTGVR